MRYPHGKVYESHFTGYFSHVHRLNEYELQLDIDRLQLFGMENTERIENRIRHVTVPVYGLALGDQLSLYLPGADLPKNAQLQYIHYAPEETASILYNHTSEAAFIEE